MLRTLITAPVLLLSLAAPTAIAGDANPRYLISTSEGDIVVELNRDKAPNTVENFVNYVEQGFYEGTIFHRVIPGFMLQAGGFTADFRQKPTQAPIKNEADNGLQNLRGTLAMARTSDPHSASAQFFINVADNAHLDHRSPTPNGWGYAVFGRVIEGMDVVDRIEGIPTGSGGPFPRDVPRATVTIDKIEAVSKTAD